MSITAQDVKNWKDVFDKQGLPSKSYIDEAFSKVFQELEHSKAELLKKALIDKGFKKYVDFLSDRFPRVVAIKENGWIYYFADDGTKDGEFIIAFSDYLRQNNCEANSVTMYFNDHSDKTLLGK